MTTQDSKIITFYSYKGGVGRSMALANVGWLLAEKYDKKVLMVDWDLEAPGLHKYFRLREDKIEKGLIDLFYDYKDILRQEISTLSQKFIEVDKYIIEYIKVFKNGGSISILPSGRLDSQYASRVSEFNWVEFYTKWHGFGFIEYLKSQLRKKAEIIVIDSRTGVTDIGGICTMQLPDVLVILFSLNEQNISGTEMIIESILKKSPEVKEQKAPPKLIILPSRIETYLEQEEKFEWEEIAAKRLRQYLPQIESKKSLKYIKQKSIPYIGYYSFGEKLAVEKDPDGELAESLGNLTTTVLNECGWKTESKILEPYNIGKETPKTFGTFRRVLSWAKLNRLVIGITVAIVAAIVLFSYTSIFKNTPQNVEELFRFKTDIQYILLVISSFFFIIGGIIGFICLSHKSRSWLKDLGFTRIIKKSIEPETYGSIFTSCGLILMLIFILSGRANLFDMDGNPVQKKAIYETGEALSIVCLFPQNTSPEEAIKELRYLMSGLQKRVKNIESVGFSSTRGDWHERSENDEIRELATDIGADITIRFANTINDRYVWSLGIARDDVRWKLERFSKQLLDGYRTIESSTEKDSSLEAAVLATVSFIQWGAYRLEKALETIEATIRIVRSSQDDVTEFTRIKAEILSDLISVSAATGEVLRMEKYEKEYQSLVSELNPKNKEDKLFMLLHELRKGKVENLQFSVEDSLWSFVTLSLYEMEHRGRMYLAHGFFKLGDNSANGNPDAASLMYLNAAIQYVTLFHVRGFSHQAKFGFAESIGNIAKLGVKRKNQTIPINNNLISSFLDSLKLLPELARGVHGAKHTKDIKSMIVSLTNVEHRNPDSLINELSKLFDFALEYSEGARLKFNELGGLKRPNQVYMYGYAFWYGVKEKLLTIGSPDSTFALLDKINKHIDPSNQDQLPFFPSMIRQITLCQRMISFQSDSLKVIEWKRKLNKVKNVARDWFDKTLASPNRREIEQEAGYLITLVQELLPGDIIQNLNDIREWISRQKVE